VALVVIAFGYLLMTNALAGKFGLAANAFDSVLRLARWLFAFCMILCVSFFVARPQQIFLAPSAGHQLMGRSALDFL
jgi:hypothetical protein